MSLELSERPPSQIEAALPFASQGRSLTGALKLLEAADLPLVDIEPADQAQISDTIWEATARWERPDGAPWPLRIYARATEQELFGFHVELGQLAPEVADQVRSCRYGIGVQCVLEDPVLWHYHAQIKLLHALAPDAAGVLDVGAARARDADWLSETATSGVPPHPENLFSIHGVHDEDRMWLHTHGLHRCGVIELDLVDVSRESAWALNHLLNAIAKRFIDHGYPPPDEPFEPGAGMELVWLPVFDALDVLPRLELGGPEDRDPIHADDRGVLLRRKKGWLWGHHYRGLEGLVPMLEDNPLLYVSNSETARAAALARERWPRFAALFGQLSEHPAFTFLVKLGFTMDGRPDDEREHLWFEIHGLDEEQLDATCLNAPYHVAELAEGQRGPHSLERLSDWAVLCATGQYGPDQIRLAEAIAQDEDLLAELARAAE